jgi:spore coat protein A, manganese oxidase
MEALETRALMAVAPPVLMPPAGLTLLNPATVPQFVNDITAINPFVGFSYTPDGPNHYTVGAYSTQQDLLGLKDAKGNPIMTTVFGYGPDAANATYPGRTFEVQQGSPIAVTWVNGLPTQHVVNIDPTLLDGEMPGMGIHYNPATNEIAEGIPAVPHLHGKHTDAIYDGTPMQWWTPDGTAMGMDYVDTQQFNPTQPANTFTYRNDQQAATLWYHDHAMGVTRLNAYAGMAGFYAIRNQWDTGAPDNPLGLPADAYEMGLAIQDKQFLSNGQLWFPANAQTVDGVSNVASTLPEMFGDTILVNGKAWPKMTVEAKRYRLRLINASDSRFYTMTLTNPATNGTTPIWQIGSDDGLLNAPVKLAALTLAPGERADIIVDFTKFKVGTRFVLTNNARAPFPAGARVVPGLTDRIMAFDVVAPVGADLSTPPAQMTSLNRTDPIPAPAVVTPTRDIALYETTDGYGRITPLLGTPASSAEFLDPITENITLGATEVWQIYNNTADTHPIHLHQVAFQVLTRNTFTTKLANLGVSASGATIWGMGQVTTKTPPVLAPRNEVAWKDTIQINPGEVITVRATFDLPGKYVVHCHILSHEEHDMMRFMQIGAVAAPAPGIVVDSTGTAVPPAGAVAPAGEFPAVARSSPFSTTLISSPSEEDELLALLA